MKPAPLTRLFMIEIAVCHVRLRWAADRPLGDSAFRVTVVPLDRSRPSPTLKPLCQSDGWNAMLARRPRPA